MRVLSTAGTCAATLIILTGCVSFFEYEPPLGHPARADAPSAEPLVSPDPFQLKAPFDAKEDSGNGAEEMQHMPGETERSGRHEGHDTK